MKTPLRRFSFAHCIALLLAALPEACYGGLLNVWIYQPVSDRSNGVPLTLLICANAYDLFWAQQQLTNSPYLSWSWQNATIDEENTDDSASAASEPTLFENDGKWIVTAKYGSVTSHGVTVTVVCPSLAITPGVPNCCTPPGCIGDPFGTNYVYGGSFVFTATYVDQNGNTLPASYLWSYESQPYFTPNSTCPVLPGGEDYTGWTQTPFQLDGNGVFVDQINNMYNNVPPVCFTTSLTWVFFGATEEGPWPPDCACYNKAIITVTQDSGTTWVNTYESDVEDSPCPYY
jgi:hypothetical protein